MGAYGIAGYPFSPPFVGGCHEKPEHDIAVDLLKIEPLLDKGTIIVAHSPASGYVDRLHSGYQSGSRTLAALVPRTDVLCHMHGHIHESFGRGGKHFNMVH